MLYLQDRILKLIRDDPGLEKDELFSKSTVMKYDKPFSTTMKLIESAGFVAKRKVKGIAYQYFLSRNGEKYLKDNFPDA